MKALFIAAALLFTASSYSQQAISIDSIGKHVDEFVKVCSVVTGVKVTDKLTMLNLEKKYPDNPLTVVVFAKDLTNFEGSLKDWNDVLVCITGRITLYKGKPQIIISKQNQLIQDAPIEDPMGH